MFLSTMGLFFSLSLTPPYSGIVSFRLSSLEAPPLNPLRGAFFSVRRRDAQDRWSANGGCCVAARPLQLEKVGPLSQLSAGTRWGGAQQTPAPRVVYRLANRYFWPPSSLILPSRSFSPFISTAICQFMNECGQNRSV